MPNQTRWTRVTDGLPELWKSDDGLPDCSDEVLVAYIRPCWLEGSAPMYAIASLDSQGVWSDYEACIGEDEIEGVIAWMPIPLFNPKIGSEPLTPEEEESLRIPNRGEPRFLHPPVSPA